MSTRESEITIGPDDQHFNDLIHNNPSRFFSQADWEELYGEELDGKGWNFGSGDPEFWKFSDILLKPGGKVLDIGMGDGSSSLFFALHGMDVLGVDPNARSVIMVNDMATKLKESLPNFNMTALELDAIEQDLPGGEFDLVILDYLNHLPSQEATYAVFDKAIKALKPGGYIWARGTSKQSSMYEQAIYEASRPSFYGQTELWAESEHVIWMPCFCSGDYKIEPTVFFDPLDFQIFFAQAGCNIVHTQTIERDGAPNIMYGENFRPDADHGLTGMITVLAQKPDLAQSA
jgi:2-polyprenyl-3-methyl-5-hydroxy-6-metoxy-1,4-benzoquinol methylase